MAKSNNEYKRYVYFKIPKEEWEQIEKEQRDISFNDLIRYKTLYKISKEGKEKGAKEAAKVRKARNDLKFYKTLERIYNSLFGKNESNRLTIYRLSKESNLPYPTAKRFWNEYNLDEWIKKFEENPNNLKIFLHQELAESLVYAGKK